jgi:hypothetical protein
LNYESYLASKIRIYGLSDLMLAWFNYKNIFCNYEFI